MKITKILITLDLNCLLGYMSPIKNLGKESVYLFDKKPSKKVNEYNIYNRPHLDQLLNSLFIKKKDYFDVAVWSSQDKEESAMQIESFFGIFRYNIKFALFTKKSEGDNDLTPIPIKRDLEIIFKKHAQYNRQNTIIISNFKNEISDYRHNEVILPIYHPLLGNTSFEADAHLYYLMEYLIIIFSMFEGNKSI